MSAFGTRGVLEKRRILNERQLSLSCQSLRVCSFWGDHALRLVLFSESADGARRYYFDLELQRAAARAAVALTSSANDAVAALL